MICQAWIADRYFLTTVTDTSSRGTLLSKSESTMLGSITAHRVKEWKSEKDAGRCSASGIEKMSQNTWNFHRLDL